MLSKLSIENMSIDQSRVTFIITEKLKNTQVGAHQEPLQFLAYPTDRNLCIVAHLTEYLQKTSTLWDVNKQLLISFIQPHKPVSKDTISNWIKNFRTSAGIDTSKYMTHSTRAAFTSHLAARQFDINDIMKAAGWSKEETFQRFYNRDIGSSFNFGSAILDSLT